MFLKLKCRELLHFLAHFLLFHLSLYFSFPPEPWKETQKTIPSLILAHPLFLISALK